jgi:predicted small lipoprotein YifL
MQRVWTALVLLLALTACGPRQHPIYGPEGQACLRQCQSENQFCIPHCFGNATCAFQCGWAAGACEQNCPVASYAVY